MKNSVFFSKLFIIDYYSNIHLSLLCSNLFSWQEITAFFYAKAMPSLISSPDGTLIGL